MKQGLLVLHGGALGDCVLTLQLAGWLRRRRPTRVTVAARSSLVRWAREAGVVDESLSLDALALHLFHDSTSSVPSPVLDRFNSFDEIISFLGGPEETFSRSLTKRVAAPVVCVDPNPDADTIAVGRHVVAQWVESLRAAGPAVPPFDPVAFAEATGSAPLLPLSTGAARPSKVSVLCHPGSGGLKKCCPLDALERLVARLTKRGWEVAWMIGPDEMERFGADYRRRLERTAPVSAFEELSSAIERVREARVYVGNDAGMTHVAGWLGLATLALFGPTDPRVWRPLGPCVRTAPFPQERESLDAWTDRVIELLETLLHRQDEEHV